VVGSGADGLAWETERTRAVTPAELLTLVAVTTLGYIMALFWYHAVNKQ